MLQTHLQQTEPTHVSALQFSWLLHAGKVKQADKQVIHLLVGRGLRVFLASHSVLRRPESQGFPKAQVNNRNVMTKRKSCHSRLGDCSQV